MSLTVFIKIENKEMHEVELGSHDTVKDLYRKAGEAAGVEEKTFLLHFEGEELDETLGGNEIQHLGMWEGCELLLCCNVCNTMCVLSQELSSEETRKAIERRLEEDPGLLLQVEVSGVDCLRLHSRLEHLPFGLRHLRVTDPKQCVIHIGDDFLAEWESLVTLDLASLQNVQGIGGCFLFGCRSLQAVDLTPFYNVTKIGNSFLAHCESLTGVDLGPLQNVMEVGISFMDNCRSLQTLDVGPLRNVTVIDERFLCFCTSLTSVDLGLPNTVSVHADFLSCCSSLTSVDLSAMQSLTKLGDNFLLCCSSLTTVNLGHLRERVTFVGSNFMNCCDNVPLQDCRLLRMSSSAKKSTFRSRCVVS